MPHDEIAGNNVWLGKWIYEQRKNKDKLTKEQTELLDKIGMDWHTSSERAWLDKYAAAREYFKQNGNLNIPLIYKSRDGSHIGIWIKRQRQSRTAGKLAESRIELLDRIGMEWNEKEVMRNAL